MYFVPQACIVRIYVGAGIPRRDKTGLPVAIENRAFRRFLDNAIPAVFPNATQYEARGLWRGGSEYSSVIEVIGEPTRESCSVLMKKARGLAAKIARKLGQQAVMVVATDIRGVSSQALVTGRKPRKRRAA